MAEKGIPLSSPASSTANAPRRTPPALETRRKGAASAIVVSARKFHALLSRTKELFLDPLQEQARKEPTLLAPIQVKAIFSSLEAILTVTKALMEDFNKIFAVEWAPTFTFGPLLCKLDIYIRSYYTSYFSNLNYALYTLGRVRSENSRFATFLNNAEEQLRSKHGHKDAPLIKYAGTERELFRPYDNIAFLQAVLAPRQTPSAPVSLADYTFLYADLPSLLLAPVHFLPKYKTLIQALLNSTSPDVQDAESLLEHLTVVSTTLHECATDLLAQHNTITQQQSIQSSSPLFLPREVVATRKLLRAGFLVQLVPQKGSVNFSSLGLDSALMPDGHTAADYSPNSSLLCSSDSPSNSQMSVRAWTQEGEGTFRGARFNLRVLLFSDVFVVAEAQQNEIKLHHLTQAMPVNDLAVDSADAGSDCSEYGMRVYSTVAELFLLDSDKASREQWLALFQKLSGKKHNVKRSFIVSEITEANTDNLIKQLSEQRLQRLHIAPNSVRPSQALALVHSIASTTSLTSVCLSHNRLDDGVTSVLATWLAEYNGLKVLRLDHNDVTAAGASSLADALRFNTSLEDLDIKYNRIADQGAASLCTSILAHPSITSLNLSHNDISCASPSARSAVRNLLRFNKLLAEFHITENFTKLDTREIIGYLTSAVLGTHVAALGRVDWNIEGIDAPIQLLLTEKLQANKSRVRRASRSGTASETHHTTSVTNGSNSHRTDSLDMGYSGYVEISMREINNSLHGVNISAITTLYLDHNTLFQIGQPVLQKLVSLRSLHLSHNRFETMPPSIKLLANLTLLDLSHNRLSRFPKEVLSLVRLQELDLSFNCIYSMGRDAIKNFGRLAVLWRLSLHRNFLSQVPQALMALPNITYLTVTSNPAIPIAKQKIYENYADRNPVLDLSRCNLKSLPMEIEYLSHLVTLDLSGNFLETLPPHIEKLKSLQTLNLTHNQLASLPWQLSHIKSLTRLLLSGNPRLVAAMQAQLHALAQAQAANAPIHPLGHSLHALQNTQVLIRPELVEREVDAKKLLSRFKEPTTKFACARMKLMLVGQENVGKTSLGHSLRRSAHIRPHITRFPTILANKTKARSRMTGHLTDPNGAYAAQTTSSPPIPIQYASAGSLPSSVAPLSTDGIDMDEWTPPTADDPISFQVWDFGGQEVYYLTHQFFLRGGRCVFLVVFSLLLGPDDNRVEYWLRVIEERARDCSIILVGTHLDTITEDKAAVMMDEIHEKYQRYTNIKHCVAVSCKTNRYIEKLKDLIIALGSADEKMKEIYPLSFFQLESVISAEKENRVPPLMTISEFRSAARACGVLPGEIPRAMDLLSQLGTIVYYNDSNAKLDDLVILDPRWLTKFMSTLITTKPTFVHNGILPRHNLEQVWRAPDYPPDLHHSLMSLLHKFEICFPFPMQEKGYLVPSLLPANRPVLAHFVPDPQTRLERLYRFDSPLYGFFSRLMVRLLHFLDGVQYWRDGILLVKDETFALLEFKTQSSQMQLRVWGAHACRCLRSIMENIDMLLDGWYFVKSTIVVPCICPTCAPADANAVPSQFRRSPKQRREVRIKRKDESETAKNRLFTTMGKQSFQSARPNIASPTTTSSSTTTATTTSSTSTTSSSRPSPSKSNPTHSKPSPTPSSNTTPSPNPTPSNPISPSSSKPAPVFNLSSSENLNPSSAPTPSSDINPPPDSTPPNTSSSPTPRSNFHKSNPPKPLPRSESSAPPPRPESPAPPRRPVDPAPPHRPVDPAPPLSTRPPLTNRPLPSTTRPPPPRPVSPAPPLTLTTKASPSSDPPAHRPPSPPATLLESKEDEISPSLSTPELLPFPSPLPSPPPLAFDSLDSTSQTRPDQRPARPNRALPSTPSKPPPLALEPQISHSEQSANDHSTQDPAPTPVFSASLSTTSPAKNMITLNKNRTTSVFEEKSPNISLNNVDHLSPDRDRAYSIANQTIYGGKRGYITYEDCELAIAKAEYTVMCPRGGGVINLDSITPELLLQDIEDETQIEVVDYSTLQIGRVIAKGGFGTVCETEFNGEKAAVKTRMLAYDLAHEMREFRREAWLSSLITHRAIVSLRAITLNPPSLIMEYIPHGTLHEFLHSRKIDEISHVMRLTILHNIADAMRHLHSRTPKICHRDLKPRNCLMSSTELNSNRETVDPADPSSPRQVQVVCKLADFGESRSVVVSATGRDNLGNPLWLAPEVIRSEAYTEKADVFSFGIVAWEILTHCDPYSEYPIGRGNFMSKLEDEILKGLRPTVPRGTPESLRSMIEQCWDAEPNMRPSFLDIYAKVKVMVRGFTTM